MIRNGKIETKKASDRADQPFSLSQPQPEDGSQVSAVVIASCEYRG
jgi:hypothetical protein